MKLLSISISIVLINICILTGNTKESTILEGHKDRVYSIAFSPDGKTIASGSWDKTIRIWDVQTKTQTNLLEGHTDIVYCVAFSPDGKTLTSGSEDYSIRLWDVKTGTPVKTLWRHIGGVYCIAFSPDGKTIASAGEDKIIQLSDATTGNLKAELEGHTSFVYSLVFGSNGRTLISGSGLLRQGYTPTAAPETQSQTGDIGDIIVWNMLTNKRISTISELRNDIYTLSISPNGEMIVGGGGLRLAGRFADLGEGGRRTGGDITVWDARTKKFKTTLKGHLHDVYSIVFSPDGNIIASGSIDATIRIWEAATGKHKTTLIGHEGGITSLSFSPDGKTLASASFDSTIRLWTLPNLTESSTSSIKKTSNSEK